MKMMKRFSLIIALALIVTVGGVYANWSYNTSSTILAERDFKPEMTAIVFGGDYVLDIQTAVTMTIDDPTVAGETPDHITDLLINGAIVFLYQPEDKAANAPVYWYAKEATPATYDDGTGVQNVFTLPATPIAIPTDGTRHISVSNVTQLEDVGATMGVTLPSTVDWSTYFDNTKDQYLIKITAEDLLASMDVVPFELPTPDDYYAFRDAIASASISIGIATDQNYLLNSWR